MTDRTVRVRLEALTAGYQSAMARATATTKAFGAQVGTSSKTATASLGTLGKTGMGLRGALADPFQAMLTPVGMSVAALGLSAKAAIDFESAWAGVTKTVEGTPAQLNAIRQGIRDMATEIPASTDEIAAVAEAAGQLGIETPAVLEFTRTMIDLGNTTNLSAEMGADALARFANITQMSQKEFSNLGSTVVELGNQYASTEAEIVDFSLRMAGAGEVAGLTEADILSIATAFSSVGVESERGGTAVQKTLLSMNDAVTTSNENLEVYARTAGMTAEEFTTAWKSDPAKAFASFVTGLGEAGDEATGILKEVELTDQRLIAAFLSLASAGDLVNKTIETGNSAWAENSALGEEAEKRYETTAAQLEVLVNHVKDLAITVGEVLLPALNAVVPVLTNIIGAAKDLLSLDLGSLIDRMGIGEAQGVWATSSAFDELRTSLSEEEKAAANAAYQHDKLLGSAIGASNAMVGLGETSDEVTTELDQTREAANNLSDALDLLFMDVDVDAARIRFRSALQDMRDALDESGGSLDIHSEKGRSARSSIISVAEAAASLAQAERKAGATRSEVAGTLQGHIRMLRDQAVASGVAEGEMDRYIRTLGLTPKEVRTLVQLLGVDTARGKLQGLMGDLGAIDGWAAAATVTVTRVGTTGEPVRHAGGEVGTTTARRVSGGLRGDEISTILQRGEIVVSRAQDRDGQFGGAADLDGLVRGLRQAMQDGRAHFDIGIDGYRVAQSMRSHSGKNSILLTGRRRAG